MSPWLKIDVVFRITFQIMLNSIELLISGTCREDIPWIRSHREIQRLESMLMQANFSNMVGEFMGAAIPKYCSRLVRNAYHNGHPDLIPANTYPQDATQYSDAGIEIKASRYLRGWQGHNAEECWLMVFCFDSSRPVDAVKGIPPKPFEFLMVAGAQLEKSDWNLSGRSETSRRTITPSINRSGYEKMTSNWIYKSPKLR